MLSFALSGNGSGQLRQTLNILGGALRDRHELAQVIGIEVARVFPGARGELKPAAVAKLTTPKKSGPRHIVFHPTKNIAYVDNEQGGSVTVYQLDLKAGTLQPLQTVSTLPADFKGSNACAEIKVHPSGNFLYTSNRGHDSIACFTIAAADGKLTSLGQAATEKTPRSFDLDPDGRFLYAAGEASGKVAAYRIDSKTGELSRFATYEVGRQPWWVMAVRLPEPKKSDEP